MEILRFCGGAILGAVTALLLRQARGECAIGVRSAAILCLLGGGVALLWPVLTRLREWANAAYGDDAALLLRALAVTLLVRICAGLCRELGEPSVADALEFAGLAELVGLSLPLIERLIDAARGLIA